MYKIKEWLSIQTSKNPGKVVLVTIFLFNIIFMIVSALVISSFKVEGTEQLSFLDAAFCTIMMILDSGCVQFVIAEIGQGGVALSIICLIVILIGMISFTGAVIGYITNYISDFIDNAESDAKKLYIHNHIVILNWNNRASEIINDLIYTNEKQKVVVLVENGKKEIQKEIEERLSDTIEKENNILLTKDNKSNRLLNWVCKKNGKYHNNVTVILREGDIFSTKQLYDISLDKAKTVIIMGDDGNVFSTKCEYKSEKIRERDGNPNTIKTLMQVAAITAAESSYDNQRIVVEITDPWTYDLVQRIITRKQVDEKCHIVPVLVNKVLGQLLSQFSLMPELNLVYNELFSNKGATFCAKEHYNQDDSVFMLEQLVNNNRAIPLTISKNKNQYHAIFSTGEEKDIYASSKMISSDFSVNINHEYWIEQKNVIILGHNSNSNEIMAGFQAFINEWGLNKENQEILRIIIIDDEKSLENNNYYQDYPFVHRVVPADIFDKDKICTTIEEFVLENDEDTTVLILSDDTVSKEELDSNALANLVYVQDIVSKMVEDDPSFDINRVDVVVEIIDPKHHDVVDNYSINNIVLSNRYISKIITQVGHNDALFSFYLDILTYDSGKNDTYESKEVYVKKVSSFFNEIPKPCSASELIRAVFDATVDFSVSEKYRTPAMTLGYIKANGEMVLFNGNQDEIEVCLSDHDKLIVFSKH